MARGDYQAATPRGGSDEIGGLVASFTEMRDEIRRQQESLQQAKEGAESANQAKSVFLATMSHEIRTPLNGIIAASRMMKGASMPPRQAEFLDSILRSANHLLAVISDILDFSKIEAGKLELVPARMHPAALSRDMERLIGPLAEARGLAFTVACGAPDDLTVLGDVDRLRQVLLNLCNNAVKFTEHGSVGLECRVLDVAGGRAALRYTVTDTGIGIDDAVRARLFERFVQADPGHAREFGGTGLGLAISRQIVELMGGELQLESEPGRGTRFWFEVDLPLAPAEPAAPPPPDVTLTGATGAARQGPRLRVLVAEDDSVTQFLMQSLMEMEGHDCVLAANGREAVDAAAATEFDVVLMDMQMPVMDGLDATRRIRALSPRYGTIPIIGMTANAQEEARRECLTAGMSHFVAKPMDPDELVRLMEEAAREGA
jgi:signal transduction histidine kinase/ActR/RegA family two-component response regulator